MSPMPVDARWTDSKTDFDTPRDPKMSLRAAIGFIAGVSLVFWTLVVVAITHLVG